MARRPLPRRSLCRSPLRCRLRNLRRKLMNTETLLSEQPFSPEQKEYLAGFFAGVAQRLPFVAHLPDGRITSQPAPGLANAAEPQSEEEQTVFGTPVSDLCEQELWKLEKNGLDT